MRRLKSERLSGIHGISVPTPFAVGDVNAYLIEGEPLTLVDCGPNWATSLVALERSLVALGYSVRELELLLVTHQHADHLGLVETIVSCSKAEVACLDLLAPFVHDFEACSSRDDSLAYEIMLAHGVPSLTANASRRVATTTRQFGSSFDVQHKLPAGAVVDLGTRRLRVVPRPGHSPSDTLFVDEKSGVGFAGDHLLPAISSNAVIAHPPGVVSLASVANRPRALPMYLASLEATKELQLAVVLPGHGPPVEAPNSLIDQRLVHHDERAARILEIVHRRQPVTAHEIAVEIWGDVAISQAYLTTCEVLGHLDLLAGRFAVVEDEGGPPIQYLATFGAGETGRISPSTA